MKSLKKVSSIIFDYRLFNIGFTLFHLRKAYLCTVSLIPNNTQNEKIKL